MPKGLQLTGMKFGRLTVLKKSSKQIDHNIRWDCLCECGNITWVIGSRLKNGVTKSCGCFTHATHNMSHSPEYQAWVDAKRRCLDTEHRQRDYYGGRGIRMQESWIDDFQSFLDYIGPRPTSSHSLDRMDNDLDYCEGNVRWATKLEQVANRGMQINNKTGTTGVVLVTNPENGFEHYKATWGPKGGKTCKSFSVSKYGREAALEMAIKARLDGLEELRIISDYSEKHGEKRQSK